MAKFNKEFEDMLAASPDGRPQTINNTTLRDLFANRSLDETKDMSQGKINAATRFFETSGMLDMTPAEVTADPVAFTKLMQGEGYQKLGKNQATRSQAFLSGILEDAGHGPSWPSRTLKSQLGKAVAKETFNFEVTRATVKEFPDDVFAKLKSSAIALKNAGDKEASAQLIMHMLGGYRPEDLAGINIEDINFKTGVAENIEIKDAGKTTIKKAVFAPPILDAIKMHVGDRKTGLLFENPQANSARINKVFDQVFGPEYLTVTSKIKGKRQEPMRVKKLRNLNESILSGFDVSGQARKALTLRASADVAEDYAASAARRKQLEKITARHLALFSAASESKSPAQFLNDIGVENQSRRTSTITATQEILEELGYEAAVSDDFFKSLPPSGEVVGGNIAGQIDPELSKQLSREQMTASELRQQKMDIELGQGAKAAAEARVIKQEASKIANREAKIAKGNNILSTIRKGYKPLATIVGGIASVPLVGTLLDSKAFASDIESGVQMQDLGFSMPTETGETLSEAYPEGYVPPPPAETLKTGFRVLESAVSPLPGSITDIPEVPSMVQAAQARQQQVQGAPGRPVTNVPQPTSLTPPSFLSIGDRLSQAREAAREGKDATGFISYKP